MNAETLTPRAQALIRELERYTRKWGADVDRSHVEHLEALLNEECESHINACQREAARVTRAMTDGADSMWSNLS